MSKPKEYYVHFTEFETGKHIFEYKRSCTNAAMRLYKYAFGIRTLIDKSAADKLAEALITLKKDVPWGLGDVLTKEEFIDITLKEYRGES